MSAQGTTALPKSVVKLNSCEEIKMLKFSLVPIFLAFVSPALAQTAPSASEISAYQGLQLAGQKGDVAAITRPITEGADVNMRDARSRTHRSICIA